VLLLAWEHWARGALSPALAASLALVELVVLALFVTVKGWKHRWLRRAA
jgi:hypothetical protein